MRFKATWVRAQIPGDGLFGAILVGARKPRSFPFF